MAAEPGFPTIDQLKVFLTVVEAGSFTAAAKRLRRAVSAISYTIATLEQQLGIELFDREGARTPVLTKAGGRGTGQAGGPGGGPPPPYPPRRAPPYWPRRVSSRSAWTTCAQAFAHCSAASRPKSPWWS